MGLLSQISAHSPHAEIELPAPMVWWWGPAQLQYFVDGSICLVDSKQTCCLHFLRLHRQPIHNNISVRRKDAVSMGWPVVAP